MTIILLLAKIHTQTKQNKQVQWWGNYPVATWHMFRLSSKMKLGDPSY